MKFIAFLLPLLAAASAGAQKFEAHFLDPRDSSVNSYLAVRPDKAPVRGLLVLLDGFGGMDIPRQTKLPETAARQGLLTIMPVLATGPLYFGADSASQASLQHIIADAVRRYHTEGKPLYLGGFSIGGTCAVKYAEDAAAGRAPLQPRAVFAVDPPLDFMRYHNAAQRMTRLATKERPATDETRYMIGRIEEQLGGTPQSVPERYYNLSPYSFSDPRQRAVKLLAATPLMLITEPQIEWWLKERGYDYDFINAPDCAALINELQRMGNQKAVLVTTRDRGYRLPEKRRHPHSWSIVDPEATVAWLLRQ